MGAPVQVLRPVPPARPISGAAPDPRPVFGPVMLAGGEPSTPYTLNGCLIGVKRFKECEP